MELFIWFVEIKKEVRLLSKKLLIRQETRTFTWYQDKWVKRTKCKKFTMN